MFNSGAQEGGSNLGLDLEKGISLETANSEPIEEKPAPFNVYLNYNNYKLQDYAMNHFNQHSKSGTLSLLGKQKKVSWDQMLQHTKVSFSGNFRHLLFCRP